MDKNRDLYIKRAKIMGFMVFILFILLLFRLYYLQFVRADELQSGALGQRGREILVSPKRGIIFDRNNIPLTNNKKIPNLIVQKDLLLEDEDLYRNIQESTSLSRSQFHNKMATEENLVMIPMDDDFVLDDLKNGLFLVDIINRYQDTNLLSHVIGYINKSENRGDSGLEKVFDEYLNIDYQETFIIEYDKSRTMILDGSYKVNQEIDPYNPSGVMVTIDKEVQELVEGIMDRERIKGAVIVSQADTSDILAMVSRPNFDQDNVQKYFYDENMALYNKAIQVGYPPGSIYKILVVLTALENDPSLIKDEYYCKGYEEINGIRINCGGHHGYISLLDGFAKSCNSVFIQLAQDVGSKEIIEMSQKLGFGSKLNIGLLEEDPGNLPKDNELLGAAVGNIAIGQGQIEVTPLQINSMMTSIVNGGINRPLRLIKGITNQDGYILKRYNFPQDQAVISEESSKILMQMLRQVVKTGTGRHIEVEDIGGSGGKTGSAEGIFNQERVIHGWFSGYFPYKNPEYVITVLVEDAVSGSGSAAPIFEKIVKGLNDLSP